MRSPASIRHVRTSTDSNTIYRNREAGNCKPELTAYRVALQGLAAARGRAFGRSGAWRGLGGLGLRPGAVARAGWQR